MEQLEGNEQSVEQGLPQVEFTTTNFPKLNQQRVKLSQNSLRINSVEKDNKFDINE